MGRSPGGVEAMLARSPLAGKDVAASHGGRRPYSTVTVTSTLPRTALE
jgi:hypothetical protein